MKNAARILEAKQEEILEKWTVEVGKDVSAAGRHEQLAVRDHLPHLLQDMTSIMKQYDDYDVIKEEDIYEQIFENSIEHGRHRATTSGYTLEQIMREYIIFHRILTNDLLEEKAYNTEVGVVIKYSIENAMLYSGSAFSKSLQEMRQKLIGILAHDMRNPISAAYLAVDMMNYEDGKERFEKVRKMAANSLKRSVDLLEGLLDSISVEAGQGITLSFSETDLLEYVTSVYEEAAEMFSAEILLECQEDHINGIFDGALVRRVLENLLSNAVKYGDREKPVTIFVRQTEGKVVLGVHNFGKPIPEEKQKTIFDFLNRADPDASKEMKSWGMGLTLVRAVAEAHGGELRLKSNEEEGTTFSISLDPFKNKPGKVQAAVRRNSEGPELK